MLRPRHIGHPGLHFVKNAPNLGRVEPSGIHRPEFSDDKGIKVAHRASAHLVSRIEISLEISRAVAEHRRSPARLTAIRHEGAPASPRNRPSPIMAPCGEVFPVVSHRSRILDPGHAMSGPLQTKDTWP